jgi:hypothetical protein
MTTDVMHRHLLSCVVTPCLVTAAFWLAFTAALFAFTSSGCVIDSPVESEPEPIARVVVAWDPLACGADGSPPHRVVVELEDNAGIALSKSTPCNAGSVSLDTAHYGTFYGRIYAWQAGEEIRSVMPVRLVVDAPVVRWWIAAPP